MTNKYNTEEIFNKWESIFHANDRVGLFNLINSDAIFYSPVVFKPQIGKEKVNIYLAAAMQVFKSTNFSYSKKVNAGCHTYAEFNCIKNNIEINGIDYIKNNGFSIIEFKVFLRPYKAIDVIWQEMKVQLENLNINM